jgi:hypothetical protein
MQITARSQTGAPFKLILLERGFSFCDCKSFSVLTIGTKSGKKLLTIVIVSGGAADFAMPESKDLLFPPSATSTVHP